MLIAATCLATPHGVVYDLPMLTGAVLLFIDHRRRTAARVSLIEIAIVLLTLSFPAAMAWSIGVPVSSVIIAAFLALVLHVRKGSHRDAATAPPGPLRFPHDL